MATDNPEDELARTARRYTPTQPHIASRATDPHPMTSLLRRFAFPAPPTGDAGETAGPKGAEPGAGPEGKEAEGRPTGAGWTATDAGSAGPSPPSIAVGTASCGSRKTNSVLPSRMRVPLVRSACRTCTPLTQVPCVLPRSTIAKSPPSKRTAACSRETNGSRMGIEPVLPRPRWIPSGPS